MAEQAPRQAVLRSTIPASAAAGTAQDQAIDSVPFAGTVSAVTFTPEAAITGAATNYRTFRVVNKGQDGSGSTVVASLAFSSSGVTAAAFDEKAIALSGVAGATTVAAGDVLIWDETTAGTGLSSPGGEVRVAVDGTS